MYYNTRIFLLIFVGSVTIFNLVKSFSNYKKAFEDSQMFTGDLSLTRRIKAKNRGIRFGNKKALEINLNEDKTELNSLKMNLQFLVDKGNYKYKPALEQVNCALECKCRKDPNSNRMSSEYLNRLKKQVTRALLLYVIEKKTINVKNVFAGALSDLSGRFLDAMHYRVTNGQQYRGRNGQQYGATNGQHRSFTNEQQQGVTNGQPQAIQNRSENIC